MLPVFCLVAAGMVLAAYLSYGDAAMELDDLCADDPLTAFDRGLVDLPASAGTNPGG